MDTTGLPLVPWWIGVTAPAAFFSWASFAYIGIATRRFRWMVWSAVYLAGFFGALAVVGNDPAPGLAAAVLFGVWLVTVGHAALINKDVERRFRERAALDPAGDR